MADARSVIKSCAMPTLLAWPIGAEPHTRPPWATTFPRDEDRQGSARGAESVFAWFPGAGTLDPGPWRTAERQRSCDSGPTELVVWFGMPLTP